MAESLACLNHDTRGCAKPATYRGLCLKCYAVAKNAVATGTTTWEELVAAGKAKAAHPNRRRFNDGHHLRRDGGYA